MGLSGALAARGEREQTPQVRREADAHLQIETLVRRAMHKNGGFPIQALSAIASLEDALVEIERAIFLQNFLRTRSLDAHDDIVVGDIDDGNEDFLQLFLELCDALQRRRDALMRAEQDLVGSQPQQRAFFAVDAFVVLRQLAGESLGDSGERVLVSSSYDDFLEMFSRHDADERRVRPLASWQEALGLRGEIDRRRSVEKEEGIALSCGDQARMRSPLGSKKTCERTFIGTQPLAVTAKTVPPLRLRPPLRSAMAIERRRLGE